MRMTILAIPLFLVSSASAQVVNGSFETGDTTGWFVVGDLPSLPPEVVSSGTLGPLGLPTQPTDGIQSLLVTFDGSGSGHAGLIQVLTIPHSQPVLLVDYAAQWDLHEAPSFTGDLHFGVALWNEYNWLGDWQIAEAVGGTTNMGTDRVTAAIDLSKFAGQSRELAINWDAFQSFSGQVGFDLDNVHFAGRRVTALQRARLAINLDFAQENEDRLDLDLIVAVPSDFDAEGQVLVVHVGGMQRELTLDAAGKAQLSADSAKLLPVKKQPDLRRLKLAIREADLANDLQPQGLEDVDTIPAGTTVALPVSVELGGETTTREMIAVYKASAGVAGKAVARTGSEVWKSAFSAKLNLQLADESTMHVRAAALVPPGFTPEGQEVRVDVGAWSKTFTLDAEGKADSTLDTDGVDSISLVRDPRNAARQIVKVKGVHGNFWDMHDVFSYDEPTPAGGITIQVPVTVTVDGRALRSIVTVQYSATLKWGTAHG